ncbi:RHS repeat domain-containing protein [Hahella sp. HN01]|uniref:RHS repeat domain-containing protein n=1 Tax=Hahella sp. HN01 TaxID=2847262 RepID=UPI001C1EDDF0|nr:RHS repeat-associated core domain-containing protein [Hahella sp. HN01]MBU6953834.1 RHS domain-containing protein [Hahella sp. HN01]
MKSLNQLTTILFSALFSLTTLLSAQAHAEADLYFIHSDHLGTPQAMTDSDQNVVWKTLQTPFGETVKETGTAVQPLRFPGQYADPESEFNYNYFRDYDPKIGRYLQSDPIGLAGGINTYAYVEQNPLLYLDPEGLSRKKGLAEAFLCAVLFICGDGDPHTPDKASGRRDPTPTEQAEHERKKRQTKTPRKRKPKGDGELPSLSPYDFPVWAACVNGQAPCDICKLWGYTNPYCESPYNPYKCEK